MIGYLKGKVIFAQKDWIILNTGNVGYKVFASVASLDPLVEVDLYIHTAISQDMTRLFGFASPEELRIFETLLDVQGVGPKLAQQIVILLGTSSIAEAINSANAAAFSSVPKVGPKLATKIIVELKDKVKWTDAGAVLANESVFVTIISALEQLGYKKNEFAHLLPEIPTDKQSDSEKIRWILSRLAN